MISYVSYGDRKCQIGGITQRDQRNIIGTFRKMETRELKRNSVPARPPKANTQPWAKIGTKSTAKKMALAVSSNSTRPASEFSTATGHSLSVMSTSSGGQVLG